jgi:formylglycine-generating enzyme required for sulfatase activity
MPQGAYSEVIKGPARKLEGTNRSLKIEESLVDALLADIEEGGAKDALPLLAFTLERLYCEHGGDGNLTLSDYEGLGRIRGSIEAAVERALKAADTDSKIPPDREARLSLLRRGLIPWLAGIDPETGRPRRRVARRSEIPPESRPLVDLLVEQRLLATDVSKDTGEITIEPMHEALLRQWGLLQGWLREDTGLLAILEGVKLASRDWAANGKEVSWLTHVGDRLKAAKRLADRPDFAASIEPTDRDYLAACRKTERTTRGRKRRLQALAAAFALLLAVSGVAWLYESYLKDQYYWLTRMGPNVLTEEQERALKAKDEFKECKNGCPLMVVVPAGKFMMGSPEGQGDEDERPQHEVMIATPFAIGKYEVTVAEWDACVAAGDCPRRGSDKEGWGHPTWPVVCVTWENVQQYVTWLSRVSGKPYRLLTEAEWEYAARAGTTTSYSFGDDEALLGDYAWYNANSEKQPHPVGEKKPNPFGLYDMHGNIWEWVQDLWHETYDGAVSDGLAWIEGGADGRRVLRGGSWYYNPTRLRSATRGWLSSDYRYNDLGFRVGRNLTP